ncbi:hypothetical protein C8R47DRAFT_1027785 [Mycena vitilis]|nr:hypothetical protein C8R47DRAFT_1027785 [Mycena vitilis]
MALPATFNPIALVPAPNDLAQQYARVRAAEKQAQQTHSAASSDLVALRVLGHTMMQTTSQEGLLHLGRAIKSCVDDDQLIKVGKFYWRYLIKLFHKAKGQTPNPSEHPSRPSFEEQRVLISLDMHPVDHTTSKEQALQRDGSRCLLTGAYDKTDRRAEKFAHMTLTGQKSVSLQAAHIIPEGLNNLTQSSINYAEESELLKLFGVEVGDDPEKNINQSTTMRTMVSTFGSPDLVDELQGVDIHRLENILTINADDHDSMDKLLLWFEATGALNEYDICLRDEGEWPQRPVDPPSLHVFQAVRRVTFRGTPELPAPSPRYLALHAACCRIAHLSGAADHLERVERDLEHFRGAPAFVVSTQALDAISEALDFGEFNHRGVLAN